MNNNPCKARHLIGHAYHPVTLYGQRDLSYKIDKSYKEAGPSMWLYSRTKILPFDPDQSTLPTDTLV